MSDTIGSSIKARRQVSAVTPKPEEKPLSNAEEAMVLHLAMVLALFQVNNNNINTDVTADEIKEQLDRSEMLTNSRFPMLDVDVLQLAFGKYRSKLEKFFGIALTDYKSRNTKQNTVVGGVGDVKGRCREFKAKFGMLKTRPTNLHKCRESVQSYRKALLGRSNTLFDITDSMGLAQLVTFVATATPTPVTTSLDPRPVTQCSRFYKPFDELKSDKQQTTRMESFLKLLHENGYSIEEAKSTLTARANVYLCL